MRQVIHLGSNIGTISAAVASAAYDVARLQEAQRSAAVTSTVAPEPEQQPVIESEKARYERTRTTRRKEPRP